MIIVLERLRKHISGIAKGKSRAYFTIKTLLKPYIIARPDAHGHALRLPIVKGKALVCLQFLGL